VSHDRYFIDRLATRVFEVAEGKVNIYPGNYEDYLWCKEGGAQQLAEATQVATAVPTTSAPAEEDRGDAKKRLNPIKLKQMTDRCSEVEAEIGQCESSIGETEAAMGIFVSAEETQRLADLLKKEKQRLSMLLHEWEELSQVIEANA
jgi:ATP-binding cassette subfamily F protein 3